MHCGDELLLAMLRIAALPGSGALGNPVVIAGQDVLNQGDELGTLQVLCIHEGTLLDALDGVVAEATRSA